MNKVITQAKRKQMEDLIYKTFTALDSTNRNTEKYKQMFSSMTDAQFDKFFKNLFSNPNLYLILNTCDYEIDLRIEDIEKAANVLNIPLFEKIAFTHYTMDNSKPVVTKEPVPVGYCHVKRTQQTLNLTLLLGSINSFNCGELSLSFLTTKLV